MKATKAKLIRTMNRVAPGSTYEKDEAAGTVTLTAPNGTVWNESGANMLVEAYTYHAGESWMPEALYDLIESVKSGLRDKEPVTRDPSDAISW